MGVQVLAVEQDESVECELKVDLQVPQSGWTNYPLTVMRRLALNLVSSRVPISPF